MRGHDHCLIAGCHEIARFHVRAYVDMDGAVRGFGRSARSLRVCSEHVEVALADCASRAAEDIRVQGYISGNPIPMKSSE
jgi:hypothetical protein